MTSIAMPPVLLAPSIERLIAQLFPDGEAVQGERALELTTPSSQPARLISANLIEGHELQARRVAGDPIVGFAAFLDGTQKSEVKAYRPGGVPIVFGSVGAVI